MKQALPPLSARSLWANSRAAFPVHLTGAFRCRFHMDAIAVNQACGLEIWHDTIKTMHALSLALIVIRSDAGLLFATACLAALMVYELLSGNLIGLRWNIWTTRRERPGLYWSAVGLKAAFVLFVAYAFWLA